MTTKPLSYKKFEDINCSSDEDDCHPNIEINTWRRLKERMRKEKGIVKREPILNDKWNTTNINRKPKIVVPDTDSTTKQATEQTSETTENNEQEKPEIVSSNTTEPQPNNISQTTAPIEEKTTSSVPTPSNTTNEKQGKENVKNADDVEESGGVVFEARSDPTKFLNENMKLLKKFTKLATMQKADAFIRKRPDLVHEASEGYLITYAVDRAVEGADTREIERIAERCLQIHNLVQSCQTGNVKPEIGVEVFYRKLTVPNLMAEYRKELAKQQMELIMRIEARRVERLREVEEEMEAEKAPLGPGGLDPTEVLNSLPQVLQEAFMTQDVAQLREVIEKMDPTEAAYHMKRCVDAGLWVENFNDENENVE